MEGEAKRLTSADDGHPNIEELYQGWVTVDDHFGPTEALPASATLLHSIVYESLPPSCVILSSVRE